MAEIIARRAGAVGAVPISSPAKFIAITAGADAGCAFRQKRKPRIAGR